MEGATVKRGSIERTGRAHGDVTIYAPRQTPTLRLMESIKRERHGEMNGGGKRWPRQ